MIEAFWGKSQHNCFWWVKTVNVCGPWVLKNLFARPTSVSGPAGQTAHTLNEHFYAAGWDLGRWVLGPAYSLCLYFSFPESHWSLSWLHLRYLLQVDSLFSQVRLPLKGEQQPWGQDLDWAKLILMCPGICGNHMAKEVHLISFQVTDINRDWSSYSVPLIWLFYH